MIIQENKTPKENALAGPRLIAIIKSVIWPAKGTAPITLNAAELAAVGRLAAKHDVVHFIALAVAQKALQIPKEKEELYQGKMLSTAVCVERLDYAYGQICQTLQQAKVPFVPLKGAVIKNLYPKSWMRTRCDIDILVQLQQTEQAIRALQQQNGYTVEFKNYHDYSLLKQGAPHIELHFSLKETHSNIDALLEHAWQYAEPTAPGSFEYRFTPAFFAFHQYAHAYYHFLNGGCGVRTVLDLFLLNSASPEEYGGAKPLLQQTGILQFAEKLNELGRAWFAGAPKTQTLTLLENYIFCGGVYGEQANRIALQQQKQGGKLRYAAAKIWPSPDVLKNHYPALRRHPWLYPAFQVRRWGKLLFCGGVRRSVRELSVNSRISAQTAGQTQKLLKELGLEKRR